MSLAVGTRSCCRALGPCKSSFPRICKRNLIANLGADMICNGAQRMFFWPNLGLDRRACEGTTAMPLATIGEKSGQGARSGALCALSSFHDICQRFSAVIEFFAAAVEETDSSGCGVKQHDLQMFVGGATVDQV